MKVKWNGKVSNEHILNGGGPQGGQIGILEYLSQTNNNTDFISEELKFKFIDNLSFLEILNLISQGLCSFNVKSHVASNVNSEHNQYLPPEFLKSQSNLDKISSWTDEHHMKLNTDKSKYTIDL